MDGIDLQELRELVEFLKANEIAEFELEKGDLKLGVKFAGPAAAAPAAGFDMGRMAQMLAGPQPGAASGTQPGAAPAAVAHVHPMGETLPGVAASVTEEALHTVKSPIVGTFYDSPAPGSPAFVKVGDRVEVGQVLCIVEAMKLMNEIESDAAGEVVERIAAVGQPVEYGQTLFTIRAR